MSFVLVALRDGTARIGELRTDHSASSYGLPVVVVDGEARSPEDVDWVGIKDDPELAELVRQAGYPVAEDFRLGLS